MQPQKERDYFSAFTLRLIALAFWLLVGFFRGRTELLQNLIVLAGLAVLIFAVASLFKRTNFKSISIPRWSPQITWIHAWVAIFIGFLIIVFAELYFETLHPVFIPSLVIIAMIPAISLLVRRAGYSPRLTNKRSNLVGKLANGMVGRTETDILAGALAAIAALTDKIDNEQAHMKAPEIISRIQAELPSANSDWLRHCIAIADEFSESDEMTPELLKLVEFYAGLVSDGSQIPQRKVRMVEWSLLLLYTILGMDGKFSSIERSTFQKMCAHFGMRVERIEQLRRKATFHSGGESTDPVEQALKLFNLSGNFSEAALEKAWHRIVLTSHPDRFHFSNPELYAKMNERFLKYRAAYDLLKKSTLAAAH